ncbi:MAG: hypothetical protein KJS91_17770, partial [Planctomycetes bacterium]|nr:hypothetical protein [Planctomycetota bacterium]
MDRSHFQPQADPAQREMARLTKDKSFRKFHGLDHFSKIGSSAESVGGLRLGEVAQLMVKGNAQMLEVPISKGSSHR